MKFQKNALAIAVMVATSTLSACSSDDIEEAITGIVEDAVLSEITLSGLSVDENSAGAEIASLSLGDIEITDSITFTTDDDNFVITGSTLSLAEGYALDYETNESVTFNITVTNGDSDYTKAVTIAVNDVLEASYSFDSKFIAGESSVSYGGQSARHALIAELKHYIGDVLQDDLENGVLTTKDEVIAKLTTYFNGATTDWEDGAFPITFTTNAKQATFSDISSGYKNLIGKVAGNDNWGQSKDWNNGDFAGWGTIGSTTPTLLIESFFDQLADNAMENSGGERYAPGTDTAIAVYVNYDGTDLNQLIQKFLLMAVTYAQGTDDYLNENKGLAASNLAEDGSTYTSLEHQFDEGFGYFGAARDYLSYNDNEISGKVDDEETNGRSDWNSEHDSDFDGVIDLLSETNFGNSVNAAKRDLGTVGNANPTNYTLDAMTAFIAGRSLINANAGMALTDEQMDELLGYRDTAVGAWEKSVAATVVHYINELTVDLDAVGTDDFDFASTAKHFSELKGFALGLQFNPYSPITDAQFAEFHSLIQDAPVLVAADVAEYQACLMAARAILQEALSFDADNVAGW